MYKVENSDGRPIASGNDLEGVVPQALHQGPDSFYAQRSEDVLAAKAENELREWQAGAGDQVLARRQQVAGEIAQVMHRPDAWTPGAVFYGIVH